MPRARRAKQRLPGHRPGAAALGGLVGVPLDELCDKLLVRLITGPTDDDIALLAVPLRSGRRHSRHLIAGPRADHLPQRAARVQSEQTGHADELLGRGAPVERQARG